MTDNILWYSWKCWHHPESGGAEVFTHEVTKRLVKLGYPVTLFCSEFEGSVREEYSDGVRIIREGGKYRVYLKAKAFYESHRNEFDIVVDEINTRPFMTPKFVQREKILAIIFQLAREYWFYETGFPINYLGYYFLEKKWLGNYNNIPTLTISASTSMDLHSWGFKDVTVIPVGLNDRPLERYSVKNSNPTIIFVGRLKKVKRPDHAISAFRSVKSKIPNAELWIVGTGYMRDKLERSAPQGVSFFGSVSEDEKFELMTKAHLIIIPGIREGWGLNVVEANSVGTPAIAYNVPGLRDAIKNDYTGVLIDPQDPKSLADAIVRYLQEPANIAANALLESRKYSWDRTVQLFIERLEKLTQRNRNSSSN